MDLFRQLEPEKSPSHRTHDSKSSRAAESLHGDDEAPAGGISSHLANHRPSQRRRWRILGVLVLVVGLAVSATAASAWFAYVSSQRREAVASSLGSVRSILGTSLERDSDLLATVNAVVATHPQLTNASLSAILSRLDLSQNYPGSFAFTYVENVSSGGLSRFEAIAKRDPPLGLATTGLAPVARSLNGQSGYCLTRLAAVEGLPGQALLRNLLLSWASPYLSAHVNFCASSFESLLESSARTGRSSVGSVVNLVKQLPGLSAIPGTLHSLVTQFPLIVDVSPVYEGSQVVPPTARARAKALAGWTFGIFDASEILDSALANEKNISLVLSYESHGAEPVVFARAGRPQPGVAAKKLTFPADPGWVVDVAVNPRISGPSPAVQALTVLSGALLLTVLLTILLNVLVASRHSAWALVEERTAELRHQALHDPLTGLPNRLLVDQKVDNFLATARSKYLPIAVFFIDLDDFKKVNDTFGHSAGDELLRAVADRLSGVVRVRDIVGRLGGDEFVVLSEGPFSQGELNAVAERLLEVLREPFLFGDASMRTLSTSASIGVAAGLRDSPEELLRDADTAMYRAKSSGKNCHVVFRAGNARGR